jgi:putative FmdB family regulatory protein
MPVYVYQCKVCGGEQELLHGITDSPKRSLHCQQCGRLTPVVRLITTVGGRVASKANPPSL